jgi:hypothetical protein
MKSHSTALIWKLMLMATVHTDLVHAKYFTLRFKIKLSIRRCCLQICPFNAYPGCPFVLSEQCPNGYDECLPWQAPCAEDNNEDECTVQ